MDPDDAKKEFLLIGMAVKDVNHSGSKEKLVRILEICEEAGAVNLGDTQQSNIHALGTPKELYRRMVDGAIAGALFDNSSSLVAALEKIKQEDTGMSVVVTGDVEEIRKICKDMGLSPHTVALSLGIMGKTDTLPPETHMQLLTMCGHGMVTERMVENAMEQVQNGKTTVDEAVLRMTKCCLCGCFNPTRAKTVLMKVI
jgi:hypothetical protein